MFHCFHAAAGLSHQGAKAEVITVPIEQRVRDGWPRARVILLHPGTWFWNAG